ncbi:hypothetical protein [Microbacterium tumbae]
MQDERELRELRAKAYGPDGTLTDAEAARLRELQSRAVGGSAHVPRVEGDRLGAAPPVGEEAPNSADPAPGPARLGGARRALRHWRLPVIVGAIAVAIGGGAGWGIAQAVSSGPSIELSAQQRAWEESIAAAGDYDPGSLRVAGLQDTIPVDGLDPEGFVAWTATEDGGEQTCLIIAGPSGSAETCDETYVAQTRSLTVSQREDWGAGRAWVTAATGFLTADGDLAARFYNYQLSAPSSASADAEAETMAAEAIAAELFPEELDLVGYDEDHSIWLATTRAGETCLVVVGMPDCMSTEDAERDGLSVGSVTSAAPDAEEMQITYRVTFLPDGSPFLTIIREPFVSDTVEVGDPGDE